MLSSKGSWSGYVDEDGELQINGKIIKFRNKLCTNCGDEVSVKIPESIINLQRFYYKYERKLVISSGGGNHLSKSTK